MIKSLLSLSHSLFFLAAGIIGLGFVISFHELGHFLVAKMFGIRVQTFSIGFGPTIVNKKIGSTHFAISAIPLGGYNDFSNPEGKSDDSLSLTTRPYYQKLLVILGGITFNILLAYIIFTLLFMTGMPATPMLPQNSLPVISKIEANSPAQKAGLQVGDTIVAVNETPIENDTKKLLEMLGSMPDQEAMITVNRQGQKEIVPITTSSIKNLGKTMGIIGTQFTLIPLPAQSIVESIKHGVALANKHLTDTYYAFKYILSSCDTSKLAGPVSIFAATSKGAEQGMKIFLIFLAIISVNLAILNLIPLPILDGGQVLFYTIEAIIGRSIPDRVREYIFIGTWIGFMILTVWLIGQDLMRMAGCYIQPILNFLGIGK
ncbi:MAG: M50 family metallopeptidase [Candidatus Babeliales bacterium]|nr:M50 family metallopeptidase [Candidatus Babeliales bacterium]